MDAPAEYFPIESGRYEVVAGLKELGTDFGNGVRDQQVFQFDDTFPHYRQNKIDCRLENIHKYMFENGYSDEIARVIHAFMINKLTTEHPQYFKVKKEDHLSRLYCVLSGDCIIYDERDYTLADPSSSYLNLFDALASQVQEDLSVWSLDQETQEDKMVAIHLCAPNHWDPKDKIGQNFVAVHEPVADHDMIIKPAKQLVKTMIEKGPFVRFAWGVATDKNLNHHPLAEPGRSFNPQKPELYLRIERQTLHGFPQTGAAFFTIRTYFEDCDEIKKDPKKCELLIQALQSMSDAALEYKGIKLARKDMIAWLSQPSPPAAF